MTACRKITKGRGPDALHRLRRHGGARPWLEFDAVMDRAKTAVGLATDRIHTLRQAIMNVRAGGTRFRAGRVWWLHRQIPDGRSSSRRG